jgi:hypothetical protein
MERIEKTFDLKLDEISGKFSSFSESLGRIKDFKEHLREIKINSIIQENRVQFELIDMNLFYGNINNSDDLISNYAFQVTDMKFILKGDDIESLYVTIVPMNTSNGRAVKKIISEDIKSSIKIAYEDGKIPRHGGFYLSI